MSYPERDRVNRGSHFLNLMTRLMRRIRCVMLHRMECQGILGACTETLAQWTVVLFLRSMRLAFEGCDGRLGRLAGLKGYSKNIEGFNAVYVFAILDTRVWAAAVFKNGKMLVDPTPSQNRWDLNVTFKDVHAFWKFVFAGGRDILESLLANDVEVCGNANYLYRFGFLARDLTDRVRLR